MESGLKVTVCVAGRHAPHPPTGSCTLVFFLAFFFVWCRVFSRPRSASLGDTHLTHLTHLTQLTHLTHLTLIQVYVPPCVFSDTQVTLLNVFSSLEFFCTSLSRARARARALSRARSLPPPSLNFAISLSLISTTHTAHTHLHQVHPKHGRKHQAKMCSQ